MERKDKVLDWSIGILFVAIVAYAELLSNNQPSIWRVYLLVGLSCFIMRLFSNSCLAYAYLKKWRYLLDFIEKHWMNGKSSLDDVKKEIEKYHYSPRTTEKRSYFIKHQLIGGFLLLFSVPFILLLFEFSIKPPKGLELIPIFILFGYYIYEIVIMTSNKQRSMPSEKVVPPITKDVVQTEERRRTKRFDEVFRIIILIATIFFNLVLNISAFEDQLFFISLFSLSLIVWIIGNLNGGEFEYPLKIFSFFTLMIFISGILMTSIEVFYIEQIFGIPLIYLFVIFLNPIVSQIISVILVLYLREAVNKKWTIGIVTVSTLAYILTVFFGIYA